MAGRAWVSHLYPLTSQEIPEFNLNTYLSSGGLPHIHRSDYATDELENYCATYLLEEIKAEALTRNVPAFAESMRLFAHSNGHEISFQSFAGDCGVSAQTIKNYIEILEDTLLAFSLPVFRGTRKRKATSRSKLYFFDCGVVRSLTRSFQVAEGSPAFGDAFKHFCILEARAANSYLKMRREFSFWRTHNGYEVDLLFDRDFAFEFKATQKPSKKHLKGLRALKEEGVFQKYILVCQCDAPRLSEDGIEIIPWQSYLKRLWSGEFALSLI